MTQPGQRDRLRTGRGTADEHRLADPALDTFPIDEGDEKAVGAGAGGGQKLYENEDERKR